MIMGRPEKYPKIHRDIIEEKRLSGAVTFCR